MKKEQLAKLWESRFQKILELEEESLSFYRDLSENNDFIAENPRLQDLLQQIIEDESRHAEICRDLVQKVQSKKTV